MADKYPYRVYTYEGVNLYIVAHFMDYSTAADFVTNPAKFGADEFGRSLYIAI